MNLKLHITLQKPPADVHFGLQKGSGNNYETVQVQKSALDDLHFELTVEIKGDAQTDELPDYKGQFVQGPKLGRFIYIDIGTYASVTESVWGRRLKIPLTGITWQIIGKLSGTPHPVLETIVPGTGKDGGPNCATVKPFDGWKIKQTR